MPTISLRPEEQEAENFLKTLNFEVLPVPTSITETPEFIVNGDARGYVVEVKTRDNSEDWTRAIKSGQVAHQKRAMGCGRWAEDVARKAVRQARSVDAQHRRWWVLWLVINCDAGADAMLEEAIGSLFGVRQVVYYDPHSEAQTMRNCLFARPGVFERHTEIVAAVVAHRRGLCFCANDEFAGDFTSFRESALWSSFARIHAPTTASDITENGGFLRADRSANRKDDDALAASLAQTYGLKKAIMLDMQVHSSSMVPSLRNRTGRMPDESATKVRKRSDSK